MDPGKLNIAVDSSMHSSAAALFSEFGEVTVADLNAELPIDAEIIVVRTRNRLDRSFLEKLPRLKIIATATSGTDHIDAEYAKSRGIKLISAPGANADSVADYVMRMLFFATDDAAYAAKLLRETKDFAGIKAANIRHEMNGRTMGIVALGAIGREIKKRAEAFGIQIKAYDPYNSDAKNSLEEGMKCDFVVVCAPLNKETDGMIAAKELALMKKTAILVNVSRAELIDENALLEALRNSKIKAAILDCFRNEPEPSPFYDMENAICTPHIAGNSEEAKERSVKALYSAIKEHLKTSA